MSASPGGDEFGAREQGPRGQGGTGSPRGEVPKGIAAAIAEVSERATLLVREEIELAKAEVAEKAGKLAKGAVVGIAAGIFFLTALFFVLIGCAWLLYYYLPIGDQFTYFWGFFAMALILVILGLIAGLIAARAVKRGAPPTPDMAIEEARRIRDTVSGGTPVLGRRAAARHGRGGRNGRSARLRIRGRPGALLWRRRPARRRSVRARRRRGSYCLMPQRSPAEIRDSIEANRNELAVSIVQLRGEVAYLADWRGHLERHRGEVHRRGRRRRPADRRANAASPSPPPLDGR